MIYIFDDRSQRRKENEEKLRQFTDLITFDTVHLIAGKKADEIIFDSIKNPDCIIFHKSYALGSDDVTFETIRQLFADFNIPIVIFSGGTEGSNKSANEFNINADLMYANLPYFLEDLKENGHINIDTLLWGKKHKLNALLEFQNKISQDYFIKNDPDAILEEPAKIMRAIVQSCKKINSNLAVAINLEINTNPQLTWSELADIIDNNIRKFQ